MVRGKAGCASIPRTWRYCRAAQCVFAVRVDTRPTHLLESGGLSYRWASCPQAARAV